MKSKLPLGLLVGSAISIWSVSWAVAPLPKEKKPVLKCDLRWTGEKDEAIFLGERITFDCPDAADLAITNISDENVDIGTVLGPIGFLTLKIKNPAGADVATKPPASFLSPISLKREPYILKPGEVYKTSMGLLRTVSDDKRVVGSWKVKAVYTFRDKEYSSAEVEVKWPGNKK